MPAYAPPLYPFPWPENLKCGDPYINWPSSQHILSGKDVDTEVAIPESWIDTGSNGQNTTKEAYSLVLNRLGRNPKDGSKNVISMYRNKPFTTSTDQFIQADKYYLEHLGTPPSHKRPIGPKWRPDPKPFPELLENCDVPYHLLSYRYSPSIWNNHLLAANEGNDWQFQLYLGDLDGAKQPLAKSGMLKTCDAYGRHVGPDPERSWRQQCKFPDYVEGQAEGKGTPYWEQPDEITFSNKGGVRVTVVKETQAQAQAHAGGAVMGYGVRVMTMFGILFLVLGGAAILLLLIWELVPKVRRMLRREPEGAVRL